jgi:hypothetical protein
MLALALVPGLMARALRDAHSPEPRVPAPRASSVRRVDSSPPVSSWPPVEWVDLGGRCGPRRYCHFGVCDMRDGPEGVCVERGLVAGPPVCIP